MNITNRDDYDFNAQRCVSKVYVVIVCLTSLCSAKTAPPRIMQTTPYDSPWIFSSLLTPKISGSTKFQRGHPPPTGDAK